MNRTLLLRAADLSRAAADAATIAASFDRIKPDQAERYWQASEDASYAALDALAQARLSVATEADWKAAVTQPEQKEAA